MNKYYIYIYIYIYETFKHMRTLFSHEKEGSLAIATTRVAFEGIIPSEISQTEKYKYCKVSLM